LIKLVKNTFIFETIGIIDVRPPPSLASCQAKEQPDIRVYALNPTSISILRDIGAWKHIEKRSQPYGSMQIWESNGPGMVRFSAKELGEEELGRITEDCTIQAGVYEAIREKGHQLDIILGSTVTSLQVASSGTNATGPAVVTISTSSSTPSTPPVLRTLTSRLLVGADGANSQIRKLGGFGSWGWGYGQEAVVCTVKMPATDPDRIPEATAWQRYLGSGSPLALLPLWGGYSSIVWSTSTLEARRLCSLSEESFLMELNNAMQSPSNIDRFASGLGSS
jgi:ubiquinone biosynthesis monooxygenase Coq6